MKKKLIVLVVLLLVVGGGVYKFVLAKPQEVKAKPKVSGSVYVLGKEFLVNLADERFAKLTVALVLDPHDTSTAAAGGGHGAAPKPPEGYGPMAQEAVVRAVITDELTDAKADDLIDGEHRGELQHHILEKLHKRTDVHVDQVLFTDVTVQ